MSEASTAQGAPLLYFVAGLLCASIASHLLARPSAKRVGSAVATIGDGEDWDSDDDGPAEVSGPCSAWGISDAPYKMVLCVNTSLSMGKGKIAAQCGHAAVGCYKRAKRHCPAGLSAWERTGCAKIAVKCPTEDEMEEIAAKALSRGIPIYLVEDAGRTQIAAGSRTVLGLGPAPVREFDGVSNHLKLM